MCSLILAFYNENELPIYSTEGPSTIMNFSAFHLTSLYALCFTMQVCCLQVNKHSLEVDAFPISSMFGMCVLFLFIASMLCRRLLGVAERTRPLDKVREVETEPLNI